MSWSFRVNNRSVLITDDQGSPLARVQCLNDKDNVRIATEIVRASMRIEELEAKVAELEAENERLSNDLDSSWQK